MHEPHEGRRPWQLVQISAAVIVSAASIVYGLHQFSTVDQPPDALQVWTPGVESALGGALKPVTMPALRAPVTKPAVLEPVTSAVRVPPPLLPPPPPPPPPPTPPPLATTIIAGVNISCRCECNFTCACFNCTRTGGMSSCTNLSMVGRRLATGPGTAAILKRLYGTKANGFKGSAQPVRPTEIIDALGRSHKPGNTIIYEGEMWRWHSVSANSADKKLWREDGGRWRRQPSEEVKKRKRAQTNERWSKLSPDERRHIKSLKRFKYPQCKRGLKQNMSALIAMPHFVAVMALNSVGARFSAVVNMLIPDGPPPLAAATAPGVLVHLTRIYQALSSNFDVGVYDVENRASGTGRVHDHGFCLSKKGGPCASVFTDRVPPPTWLAKAKPEAFRAQMETLKQTCSKPKTLCLHYGGSEGDIYYGLGVPSADILPPLRFILGASGGGVFTPSDTCPKMSLAGDALVPLLLRQKHAHLGLEDATHEFSFLRFFRMTFQAHAAELKTLLQDISEDDGCPTPPWRKQGGPKKTIKKRKKQGKSKRG